MECVSPVLTENEIVFERVLALDQPEFTPLVVLPIEYTDGVKATAIRFRLSDRERKLITSGADIFLIQMYVDGFAPISVNLAMPGERPE